MITALILSTTLLLTNSVQVTSHLDESSVGMSFDITGRLVFEHGMLNGTCIVEDDAGSLSMSHNFVDPDGPRAHQAFADCVGSIVRMTGKIIRKSGNRGIGAHCTDFRLVHREQPPQPPQVSGRQLADSVHANRIVGIRGHVQDAFKDEIDTFYYWLSVDTGDGIVNAVIPSRTNLLPGIRALIGSEVSLRGLCTDTGGGSRLFLGHHLELRDPAAIAVIGSGGQDLFAAPLLERGITSPQNIASLGYRRFAGTVRCSWDGKFALVETDDGTMHNVETADGVLPAIGSRIEVVGLPETDLYRINLSRASWRVTAGSEAPSRSTATSRPVTELSAETRRDRIDILRHGSAVRLTGEVVGLSGDQSVTVRSEGEMHHVDISACPSAAGKLALGSRVELTGIFIVQTETWRPNRPLPRVQRVLVAVEDVSDITVLARPSWLTVDRLLALLAVLLAALAGVLVWNVLLRRLVERRGRELLREEIGRVEATLRVDERTHLAVELHDALSQTLTGVALQIDAAERARQKAPDRLAGHLATAHRTLESCREELRNCLWDLRNQALEINDVDRAIRQTLEPHIGDAALSVRFALARSKLSDTTMHAVLRIVRELAVNAVRHGRARSIRVAGSVESGKLMFSVKDDGCGFNPTNRPGIDTGHFGLHGIGERIASLGGAVDIMSAAGKGAKVTISLPISGTVDA